MGTFYAFSGGSIEMQELVGVALHEIMPPGNKLGLLHIFYYLLVAFSQVLIGSRRVYVRLQAPLFSRAVKRKGHSVILEGRLRLLRVGA